MPFYAGVLRVTSKFHLVIRFNTLSQNNNPTQDDMNTNVHMGE